MESAEGGIVKIAKIDSMPLDLHLKEPFIIANVAMTVMQFVLVRVETDEGIVGWGEAIPAWEVTGETRGSVMSCVRLFADAGLLEYSLLGKEIGSLDAVRELMDAIEPKAGLRLVYGNPSAIAAIEQAMLDACAKRAGAPLYRLLGAENRPVEYTRNISILGVEETLSRVASGIEKGFGIIRLKLGRPGVGGLPGYRRDVEVVLGARRLIEGARSRARLIADANQGFVTVDNAVEFCRSVDGALDWLESPTAAGDLHAFKRIKDKCSVPLMADEAVHGYESALTLLEIGGVDYINVKLMKTGGLLRAMDLFDLAAERGVQCQVGSMIESTYGSAMGVCAALARPEAVSTDLNSFELLADNYAEGLSIAGERLRLGELPGCGCRFEAKDLPSQPA
jgi:L-alanine-DL-glutamate epimerase-like enolase superfamily enzyme